MKRILPFIIIVCAVAVAGCSRAKPAPTPVTPPTALIVRAATPPSEQELRAAVTSLEHNFGPGLELFFQSPDSATAMLLEELRPVKPGKYLATQHPHVVWCLRALRSLAGKDFKARTRGRLSDDERHFLGASKAGSVCFFGTWMSRDTAYVAPLDAQRSIIEQWRRWFAQNRGHVKYVNSRDPDVYYF